MVRLGMITNKIDYKVYSNKPFAIWANSRIINERLSANSYNRDYLDFAKAKNTFNFKKVSDIAKVTAMIGWKGLTTDDYVDEDGVYLLRTVDIKDNYIDLENAVMAKREKVYEQPQIFLKQGDIIFSKDGTLGITAIVPRHQNKEMCVGSTLARIRLNSNLDNYYVCAAFMSKIVQAQIGYFTSGIAQPHITQEYINKLEIPIPSPEIQKYIGDKIRKAEELREEAKRLKKDAEEIFYEAIEIDKLNSKLIKVTKFSWIKENQIEDRLDLKYNSPSIITIYEHFRKYKCSLLKDEFKTISGYAFSSGDFDDMDGEKVIKIGDISDFTIDTTSLTRVKIGTKVKERIREFSCNIQDLVYAMTGATIGKVAMYIDNETVYINQRVACIKPKRNNIPTGYLLLYLNSDIGKEISYSLSTGVAQPNIALEELNNIVIPQLANNIMDKIHHNVLNSLIKHKESKQLIQEAKQDVEDLIEGNFDMSKVKANS